MTSVDTPPSATTTVRSAATWLFAATIFLGACLLFQVQPLIGKYILPWFGGSPAVWTTCMLFFQVVLLAGYAYAHFTSQHLLPRGQAVVHIALLVAAMAVLPIVPSDAWKPSPETNPIARILVLLLLCVGLPYFALSATSPLLQRWFSNLWPARSPWRLYALSNLGSMLALLSYPFLIEPRWTRREQAVGWSMLLGVFAAVCAACALTIARRQIQPIRCDRGDESAPIKRRRLTDSLLWLGLPACASSLLLAITNKICQDIAVIPFLWVVPLAIYLLSFIICFEWPILYNRIVFIPALAAAFAGVIYSIHKGNELRIQWHILIYCGVLLVGCIICHGEVYRRRPEPRGLTAFYLCLSIGGALGGVFVALVAPLVFTSFIELQISLIACCVLTTLALVADPRSVFRYSSVPRTMAGLLAGAFVVGLGMGTRTMQIQEHVRRGELLKGGRNFYGVLSVYKVDRSSEPGWTYRQLVHGAIRHGLQYDDPAKTLWPTTYYGPGSGAGLALRLLDPDRPRRVGLVGLGVGTLACYGKAGDVFRFYEINPLVRDIASDYFTYLRDARAKCEIVMGDARLSMERESPQNYDIIVLDAFSGDAIPVHLLTREAVRIYQKHLRPGGVIAVHISNHHLLLHPIVRRLGQDGGFQSLYLIDNPSDRFNELNKKLGKLPQTETEARERLIKQIDDLRGRDNSTWVLLTTNQAFIDEHEVWNNTERDNLDLSKVRLWTDDDSNLFEILRKPRKSTPRPRRRGLPAARESGSRASLWLRRGLRSRSRC